jgi:hypothetical protein
MLGDEFRQGIADLIVDSFHAQMIAGNLIGHVAIHVLRNLF